MIDITTKNIANDIFDNSTYYNTKNITMKHPILKIEHNKKYTTITLLNGEKYRVGDDGYFVRCDLRIV